MRAPARACVCVVKSLPPCRCEHHALSEGPGAGKCGQAWQGKTLRARLEGKTARVELGRRSSDRARTRPEDDRGKDQAPGVHRVVSIGRQSEHGILAQEIPRRTILEPGLLVVDCLVRVPPNTTPENAQRYTCRTRCTPDTCYSCGEPLTPRQHT